MMPIQRRLKSSSVGAYQVVNVAKLLNQPRKNVLANSRKFMSRYELNKISNVVMKAAKAVYDKEKFPIGVLAVRARKLAHIYPTDTTVVGCSNFLTKRAESNA